MSQTSAVGRWVDLVRERFGERAPRVLAPLFASSAGAALAFDLEVLRMPAGRWQDLGCAAPGNLLDLPLAALHDLGCTDEELAACMLDAGALSFAAIFLAEATAGAEAGHDASSALLLGALVSAATARLVAGHANPARASAHFAEAWATQAAAMERAGRREDAWIDGAETATVFEALGQRHAPLGALFACSLEIAGRAELVATLRSAVGAILGVAALVRDLDELSRDLARGWWSLPIARLAASMGSLPGARFAPPPAAPVLLGMALTRVVPVLAADALARVGAAERAFFDAGLTGVAGYGTKLGDRLRVVLDSYDSKAPAKEAGKRPPVAFRIDTRPRREQALGMLRAALDDDREAREAWCVLREGSRGETPRVDRFSGPATILMNRIHAGEQRTADVDSMMRSLDVATGDLGEHALAMLASLASHATDPIAAREGLQPRLQACSNAPRRSACAGVEVALALAQLSWPRVDAGRLGAAALERVATHGTGAFVDYDPLYGALLVFELGAALRAQGIVHADAASAWAVAFAERSPGVPRVPRSPRRGSGSSPGIQTPVPCAIEAGSCGC